MIAFHDHNGTVSVKEQGKVTTMNNGYGFGNGPGFGQGYGGGNAQTGEFEEALRRMDGATRDPSARDPFIGIGSHILMVVEVEPYIKQGDGPCGRATFEVLKSDSHPVGSRVCKIWKFGRRPKFESQISDSEHFASMVRMALGAQPGTNVGQQCAALIRDRVGDQILRGVIVGAYGVENQKKTYVNVTWSSVPQTRDEIVARRAALEARIGQRPAAAPAQQQQMQQPQMGPMPGAPLPQQGFVQQYQQQPMPPQQGFVQQYQQQPMPPQQLMQGPPPGYTAQNFGAQPQQNAPAPQPPQGGPLLAQIPGFDKPF